MRELTVGIERSRFAETLPRTQLSEMEGAIESADKGMVPTRNLIIKERNQLPRLMAMISSNIDEAMAIDRTEMQKHYQQTGSYTEALAKSLYEFFPGDIEYVTPLTQPKTPDTQKEFKRFQKDIRQIFKERNEYLRDHPVHNYYAQVSSKKNLDEDQSQKREWLLKQKDLKPDWFRENWNKGIFHRLTWISRLKGTQLSEAQLIASALEKNQDATLVIEDLGLTDVEIQNGFQHSGQLFEKILFKAFISGDRNLTCFVEVYKKLALLVPQAKFRTTKISSTLANGDAISDEDYQWYLKVLTELKIPSALFLR